MSKNCLVISTIYEEDTRERESFDDKIRYLIKPVLTELDYQMILADERHIVGMISPKTIKEIINSDVVIADISDNNPNVFYEIAIRNSLNMPLIILKQPAQGKLFGIDDSRILSIEGSSPWLWHETIMKLKMQIQKAEKDKVSTSHSILADFGFSHKLIHDKSSESKFLEIVDDLKEEIRKLKVQDYKDNESKTKMMLKCKHCGTVFPSKTQIDPEMFKNYQLKRFEKCPSCNTISRYEKESFVFVNPK